MAKNKKTIQVYPDWRHPINTMPDELAGKIFKQILNYCNENGEEYPDPEDVMLNAVWQSYKLILKRDLKKYIKVVERNRKNGALGGRPKTQKNPDKPNGYFGNPNKPQKADKDKDKDINTTYLIEADDVKNTVDNSTFFKHLKDNPQQQWIEQVYITWRLKPQKFSKLMMEFDQHTKIQQVQHPNFGKFKDHFVSWVRKQGQIGNLKQYQI